MERGRSSKTHRIARGQNALDAASTRVTLSMTVRERDVLRALAIEHGMTVSGLIQAWVDERCGTLPSVGDGRVRLNVKQRMDGLTMLGQLADECAACGFFDPQYRGLLDRLDYGNEGLRQRGRASLEQMDGELIGAFVRELGRVIVRGGYLMLWLDKYHLCEGSVHTWTEGTSLHVVDLITWNKRVFGMGWRSRHVSEYLVALQKAPLHAARTWKDHSLPDVWEERVSKTHPHSKPVELQERLIRAVTQPGELVVDPAAGGYSVLEACMRCDRNFIGCDIQFGEGVGE